MNNQQTTGSALGKGSGSLPQSSTLVTVCHINDGEVLHKSQLSYLDWSIWHEFELTIHMVENDKMARLGENDGFQWRKGWRK